MKAKNRWERLGLAPTPVVVSHQRGAHKPVTPPSKLRLSEITLDARLRVRGVDEEVAGEYAEHIDELPPVTVWLVGESYLLVNGWHRYRAHELAGATHVRVVVATGSYQQAMLHVAGVDKHVGLPRNREAKRAAVLLVLATANAAAWSDREVAKHCGVSHTFVAQLRGRGVDPVSGATIESGDISNRHDAPSSSTSKASGNVATQVDAQERIATEPSGNVATQDDADSAREHRRESAPPTAAAPRPAWPLLEREVEVTETDSTDIDAARRRLRGEDLTPPPVGRETFQVGVPTAVAQRLTELAADMNIEVEDAILEGVFLILRYHQRAKGLPIPTAPVEAAS